MTGRWKTDAKWYATIDAAIAELNAAGKSDQDIARDLGISQGQASYRRGKLGLASPYTAGTHEKKAQEKTSAGKAKEAEITRHRCEVAIPMGRGGDVTFGRLLDGRSFEDDSRLRPGKGPLPAPLPLPNIERSMAGSAAAWCASMGSKSRTAV